jgi:hypothetical protein
VPKIDAWTKGAIAVPESNRYGVREAVGRRKIEVRIPVHVGDRDELAIGGRKIVPVSEVAGTITQQDGDRTRLSIRSHDIEA